MNSLEDSSLLKKHIQFLDRVFKGSYFEGSEEDFNRSSKNIKDVDPNFSNWINISGKPNPFYSRKNYFEIRYKDLIYLGATRPYILRRDHPFFHIVVEISKKMGFKCHLPTKDIEVSFADTKGDTAFYQKSNATVKISSEISGDRVWPILFHELTHVCQELDDYEDYVTPEKNYFEYLIQKKEVEARIVQGVIYIELNGHSLSDIPYLKISPLDILGAEGSFARIFQEWKELENKDLAIEFSKKFGVSTLKSVRCAKKAQELSKEELNLIDYLVLDGADLEKAVDTVIFLKNYKNNDEFKNKKWPYKPKRSLRKKLNVMFKENPSQPEDDVKNMTLKEAQGIYSDPVKEFIRFSKKVEKKYGSEIKDPTNPELSKKRKLMLKFLEGNGFEEVGEGAYRRVFLSPGGELIKITESDYGLEQNRREITLFNSDRTGIFPKVEEVGMNGEWFIVEKIEPLPSSANNEDIVTDTFANAFPKFFELFGHDIISFFNKGVESEFDYFFKEFEDNIKDFNEISKRLGKDKAIERFKSVPYKWKMLEYVKNSDLNFKKLYHAYKTHGLEDLHIGNVFFTKDGDVKVIDAGFTKIPESGPLLENNVLSEGMIRVPEDLGFEFWRLYSNFTDRKRDVLILSDDIADVIFRPLILLHTFVKYISNTGFKEKNIYNLYIEVINEINELIKTKNLEKEIDSIDGINSINVNAVKWLAKDATYYIRKIVQNEDVTNITKEPEKDDNFRKFILTYVLFFENYISFLKSNYDLDYDSEEDTLLGKCKEFLQNFLLISIDSVYETETLKKYGINRLNFSPVEGVNKSDGNVTAGYYDPSKSEVVIYSSKLVGFDEVAYHEFIHALQFLNTKEKFHSNGKFPRYKKGKFYGLPQKNSDPNQDGPHALRPIEFYTRLHDSLHYFVWLIVHKSGQIDVKKEFTDFVKTDHFFSQLREHKPSNYKKAVRELYKAVNIAYKVFTNNPKINFAKLLSVADENFVLDEKDRKGIWGGDPLNESTRFKRETGEEPPRGIEKIAPLVSDPFMFVTFSDVNKVGINPKTIWDTPLGVYTYPLDKKWFNNIKNNKIPFAGHREFLHVIQIKPENRGNFVIVQSSGNSNYSASRYNSDIEKIKNYIKKDGLEITSDEIESFAADSKNQTPFGRLWNVTRMIGNSVGKSKTDVVFDLLNSKNTGKKNHIKWTELLRVIGIDGVIDYGSGLIHENEPEQAIFLNPKSFKQVLTVTSEEINRSKTSAVSNMPEVLEIKEDVDALINAFSEIPSGYSADVDHVKIGWQIKGLLPDFKNIVEKFNAFPPALQRIAGIYILIKMKTAYSAIFAEIGSSHDILTLSRLKVNLTRTLERAERLSEELISMGVWKSRLESIVSYGGQDKFAVLCSFIFDHFVKTGAGTFYIIKYNKIQQAAQRCIWDILDNSSIDSTEELNAVVDRLLLLPLRELNSLVNTNNDSLQGTDNFPELSSIVRQEVSRHKRISALSEGMLDEKDSLNESLQISAFPEWFGDFKKISHAHILDVAKDFLPVENSKYLDHIQSSFTDKQGIFYDEAEACFNELIDYFGDMACVGVPTAIDVEIMESKMYDLERAGGVVNTITETPNTFRVEIFKPTSREFNSTLSGVFFEWIDNKVNAGWIGGTTYSITPKNKESVLIKIKKLANNELRRANNLKSYIDNSRAMIGDIGSSYSHPKQKYRIQRDYDSISVFDADNNLLSSLKIDCDGDCPDIISLGDGNNMSLNMNGLFSDASTYSGRGAMKLDDLYKFFNKFRRSINRTMIRSSRESILDNNNSLLFENAE